MDMTNRERIADTFAKILKMMTPDGHECAAFSLWLDDDGELFLKGGLAAALPHGHCLDGWEFDGRRTLTVTMINPYQPPPGNRMRLGIDLCTGAVRETETGFEGEGT